MIFLKRLCRVEGDIIYQIKWMMKIKCFYGLVILIGLFACENDDNTGNEQPLEFNYSFSTGTEGWIGDFADLPPGEDDFYELEFEHTGLPGPLDEEDGALMLSGNNHSDDLFMYIKKELTDLNPGQKYLITFEVEFATNVAEGMFGIGGSPGEGVYIKVGATASEPEKELDEDGFLRLKIDKNNQSQSGEDMVVIGNFANGTDINEYTLKTLSNSTPFRATASNDGALWLLVGTESGFEGTTTIFFNNIEVILIEQ